MASVDIGKYKALSKDQVKSPSKGFIETLSELLSKDIQLGGNKLSSKLKENFYSEMGMLLSAGVDIRTALDLMAEEQQKQKHKLVFEILRDNLVSGSSLSQAMQQSGKFSEYEFHSVSIGEESGKLSEVLKELGKYYTNQLKQRRQIIGAFSYPAIVLLTAGGVLFFMLNYVVPMFADIFTRSKSELPLLTLYVIKASNIVSHYSGYMFLLLIATAVFFYSQQKKVWYRKFFSSLWLRVPIFGKMTKKIYTARFCHSMHLLASAHTPLVKAISMVKNMIGFYPMESSLDEVQEDIMKGSSLHQSLRKFPVYDRKMVSLMKVAEEVNQLELVFEKLNIQYTEEVEHQASVLNTVVEPVLIVFIGLFVGLILLAMYLPMFQLGNVVQ